jgi:hypothetical protein
MSKEVLEFSVRTSADASLEEVRDAVEAAFNLRFAEGEFEDNPGYLCKLLGMQVGLFPWAGVIVLESRIEDRRFLGDAKAGRIEIVQISKAVADMLTILGPYDWRVATDEDLAEDLRFDEERDGDYGPPRWADQS